MICHQRLSGDPSRLRWSALRTRYAAQAVEALGLAADRGYRDVGQVEASPLFNPIRGSQDYQRVIARMKARRTFAKLLGR
jgi:hypothetical protein